MKVIIDTREQKPIKFPRFEVKTLNVGDYTTEKLYKVFHVERKSPMDLYGTLFKGHRVFRKALKRAEDQNIRIAIFIECTKKDLFDKNFRGSLYLERCKAETLKKMMNTLSLRYGIEFVFCNGRASMRTKIITRFKKEENELSKKITQ